MCLSLKPALSSSWCWVRCRATPLPITSTWWPQRACSTWPLRTWQRLCLSVCSAPPSPSCCVPWRPSPNTRRSANISDYRSASGLTCQWAVNYWILVSFHCHKPYAGVDCAGFPPLHLCVLVTRGLRLSLQVQKNCLLALCSEYILQDVPFDKLVCLRTVMLWV